DLAHLRNKQGRFEETLKLYDSILALDYHFKDALALRQETDKRLQESAKSAGEAKSGLPMARVSPGILTGEHKIVDKDVRMVNQRCRVKREIGRGGMGIVYEAWDETLQRPVALKFLPMSLSANDSNDKNLQKFLNEARSAARLNHPNIVTI